jgi:ribosomal protein S18 acetylase RimI-like enzyme
MIMLLSQCGLLHDLDYSEFTPPVLVAVVDDRVVGMISALVGKPMTYISELAVHPEYERKALASSLVYSMETLLRTIGVKAWCAFVREDRDLNTYLKQWPGAENVGTGESWTRKL